MQTEQVGFSTRRKKQILFQFNVPKVENKIKEWLDVAVRLRDKLPPDDAVFAHWYDTLMEFKKNLPLLQMLGSEALKVDCK